MLNARLHGDIDDRHRSLRSDRRFYHVYKEFSVVGDGQFSYMSFRDDAKLS